MANEAVIIELGYNGGNPVNRTVANGDTILKGTLCKLEDHNTASGSGISTGDSFAGIAAADKLAGDGSGTLSCYTEGVFDIKNNSAPTINRGHLVCMSGANMIREIVVNELMNGVVVGQVEETATGDEVVRVRLGRM